MGRLEFGLRAKEAGYPTVTFPGAAVWHVPWTDKNDAVDWQAFFHQRNRFVAALLHSPYAHGGRMVRESRNHQIAHLVSIQYSTVEIRHQAMLDVLSGPGRLHDVLPTKLAEVNAFRKQFTDAQLQPDPDAFPPVRRKKPPSKGQEHRRGAQPARAAGHRWAGAYPAAEDAAADGEGPPRGGDPRDGRQVVPPGELRLGHRLDERRHVGCVLPA